MRITENRLRKIIRACILESFFDEYTTDDEVVSSMSTEDVEDEASVRKHLLNKYGPSVSDEKTQSVMDKSASMKRRRRR